MPSYKLTYFNVPGRAEPTRLAFAAAGVKYEDCRVTSEEFQKLKASGILPFGQLPILEVDGKVLPASITILKFVARETGLSPTDSFEIAKADAIVDGLQDVMLIAYKFYVEKNEETKKALTKTFYEEDLPKAFVNFEQLLKSNGGKYFAGTKMSYADIMFFSLVDGLFSQREEEIPSALEKFPQLKGLFSEVKSNPGVKEWLSKRPKPPI